MMTDEQVKKARAAAAQGTSAKAIAVMLDADVQEVRDAIRDVHRAPVEAPSQARRAISEAAAKRTLQRAEYERYRATQEKLGIIVPPWRDPDDGGSQLTRLNDELKRGLRMANTEVGGIGKGRCGL